MVSLEPVETDMKDAAIAQKRSEKTIHSCFIRALRKICLLGHGYLVVLYLIEYYQVEDAKAMLIYRLPVKLSNIDAKVCRRIC